MPHDPRKPANDPLPMTPEVDERANRAMGAHIFDTDGLPDDVARDVPAAEQDAEEREAEERD